MLTFFKVAAIVMSIPAFVLFASSLYLIIQILNLVSQTTQQDSVTRLVDLILPENLSDGQKRLLQRLIDISTKLQRIRFMEPGDGTFLPAFIPGWQSIPIYSNASFTMLERFTAIVSNAIKLARPNDFEISGKQLPPRLLEVMMVSIALFSRGVESDSKAALKVNSYQLCAM
jgi:hypothetical protein